LFFTSVAYGGVAASAKDVSLDNNAAMVLIPAGEFIMGLDQDDPKGLVWASPKRNVFISDFYIDKYEVTNREYKRFVDGTDHRVPFDDRYDTIYDWKDGIYKNNFKDHPVSLVDWYDANAYCKWVGKRLPTEAEWEKAARGTDGRDWPWKGGFDRFKANTADFKLQMTLPVGSFPEGASHYGVMDMTGNLFEWVDDWFKGYLGIKLESRRFGETFKVTRGSAWTSFADPYGYTFSRTAQIPSHKHRSIGFRCAKSTITQ